MFALSKCRRLPLSFLSLHFFNNSIIALFEQAKPKIRGPLNFLVISSLLPSNHKPALTVISSTKTYLLWLKSIINFGYRVLKKRK